MKKVLSILFLFFTINFYSQKDSIVSYLDINFKTISEKSAAHFLKIRVKRKSLWEIRIYYRDGKIFSKGYRKKSNDDFYVGKYLQFHRNGQLERREIYNNEGSENGNIITYFSNGNKNFTGQYANGSQINLWKYYHFNGKLAAKFYYDSKNNLNKLLLYDENEEQLETSEYIKYQKAEFKKGEEEFKNLIKILPYKVSYYVNTTLYINFIIDVNGAITDVWVVNNIPEKLDQQIEKYLTSIKGWKPTIEMNRKVPTKMNIPLKFVVIED